MQAAQAAQEQEALAQEAQAALVWEDQAQEAQAALGAGVSMCACVRVYACVCMRADLTAPNRS